MKIPCIRSARTLLAGIVLAGSVGLFSVTPHTVLAGATAPEQARASVDLREASLDKIRTHILDSCVLREWGASTETKRAYAERCNCYARRVTLELTSDEVDEFRQSGFYNASARPKAEAAQIKCDIK